VSADGSLREFVDLLAGAIADRLAAAGPDRLLDAGEVAEMLRVPQRWVRDATRDGRLPHVKLGRHVRYRREELLAYIAENANRGRPFRPRGRGGRI
jgi:excisionase family DNA binding protein